MTKIPFDIKYRPQIESGEYELRTADGAHSVRIICWDAEGSQRNDDIIGLEKGALGAENIQRYDYTGHLIADSARRNNKDLVIIAKPELTEFEKKVIDIIVGVETGEIMPNEGERVKDMAIRYAADLLSLAKKELTDALQLQFDDDINNAYYKGKADGKAEAFEDLPKWKISNAPPMNFPSIMMGENGLFLYKSGYEISLDDIDKLPVEGDKNG